MESLVRHHVVGLENFIALAIFYYQICLTGQTNDRLGNYLRLVNMCFLLGLHVHDLYYSAAEVDRVALGHVGLYKNFCGWKPQTWSGFLSQLRSPQQPPSLRTPRPPNQKQLVKYDF